MIIVLIIKKEAVMQKTLKHSKQRDAILSLLQSVKNHPTAEWLHRELKKEFPNIGLATVYRNLNLLAEQGEILRLECSIGPEHYDGNTKRHYHFVCRGCSEIIDICLPEQFSLNELAEKNNSLKVEEHALFFYGLCKNCM